MNPCIEYKTPTPDGVKKLVVMEEEWTWISEGRGVDPGE